jgi:Mn2+/Fe2+ NRAMP family transporter
MFNTNKKILQSIGSGFIMASVVLGLGSITLASKISSEHGYAFLWIIILAAIFMMVYASMGTPFGVVNN